jgi:hypothetical protein
VGDNPLSSLWLEEIAYRLKFQKKECYVRALTSKAKDALYCSCYRSGEDNSRSVSLLTPVTVTLITDT